MEIDGIKISWLGHSSFVIRNSKLIYIDPYNLKEGVEKADLIFITHNHYDHCSIADLQKIVKDGTRIIMPADCQSKITKFSIPVKIDIIEPGKELSIGEIKVSAVHAYNINKPFHPKEEEGVGYIIKINGLLIYHAGDTDLIPEMNNLTGYNQPNKKFIALLPIGGRFTMNPEEAAESAKIIKPYLAIPMHYGSIVGTDDDAKEFLELCEENGVRAEILPKD
ncbi:MBL fold metallo-hydrolase [Candidatus Pacearchaeota archaeon]|nr:MBL fold metallo-hydrolase [Candidatus Pacearchaeota archaeon]